MKRTLLTLAAIVLAMIGAAAYYKYRAEGPDSLDLDAYADLEM